MTTNLRRACHLTLALFALAGRAAAAAEVMVLPEYAGRWVVNEKLSDDVEKKMDEMRPMRTRPRDDETSGERRGVHADEKGPQHPVVEKEDDETSFFGGLFGHKHKPGREGPMHKLMATRVIEIALDGKGYLVTYDGALQRHVVPHLGKVYSASGAELVADDLGETLAYWKDGDLVLETEMKPRGYLVQRFILAPDHASMIVRTLVKRFESERENEDAPRLKRIFERQAHAAP
jgi:hypothetical protein